MYVCTCVCVLQLYRRDTANRDLYFLQSLKGGLVLSESHHRFMVTHTHTRAHTNAHKHLQSNQNLAVETAEHHGSVVVLANDQIY